VQNCHKTAGIRARLTSRFRCEVLGVILMAGLSTRLLIAQKVLAGLQTEDPALYAKLADPQNQKWYLFGALGPAIGDFVPSSRPTSTSPPINAYYVIWQLILGIAVGNQTSTPPLPGLAAALQTVTSAVSTLSTLVANHDFNGLRAFKNSGQITAINNAVSDLTQILQYFSQPANLQPITNEICTLEPLINAPAVVPTSLWSGRDWLYWRHTGDFAEALYKAAQSQANDAYLAYAVGWQVAFATLVCSSGFMNSIVGTTYRTYWWRHRWMDLVVDAWCWGYYGANAEMTDDGNNPNPPYSSWPSLCAAGLHNLIDLTNGQTPLTVAQAVVNQQSLPDIPAITDFANNFWLPVWTQANADSVTAAPPPPVFSADGLLTGYYMLWLLLWFQTSGDVIGCNPAPPATPPSSCGANPQPPGWIDPTKTNPVTGQPFLPQEPTPSWSPNIGEVICGAVLAALGIASEFFGGGAVGIAAAVGGIDAMVNGLEQLNWDQLDCQLYWLKVYLYNGLEALHKLAVLAGLQPPYAQDLGTSAGALTFGVFSVNFPVAGDQCRSMPVASPLMPWNCTLIGSPPPNSTDTALDWTEYPTWAAEAPAALLFGWRRWWPDSFVDNKQGSNPGGSDIATAPASYDAGVSEPFPPGVSTALGLITAPPAQLPNWNLDGDRGLGWLTWQLAAGYTTPVQTVPGT
jgi:hypothetical protein